MKDYILFELKGFLKKRKTLYLVLALLGGALWLFGSIQFQGLGNHEAEMYDELNQTRLTLRSIETYYQEDPKEETLSDNIFKQQSLSATMYNGILFEENEWLYDSGQELAQLRIEFEELNQDENLPDSLFPPLHESKRQVAEYSALQESNHEVLKDSRNTTDYLRLLMQYFGVFAFIFLAIFSSDIGIEDFKHPTMVKGYPIHPVPRLFTQISISLGSILAGSFLVLFLTVLFVAFYWGITDLSYPMAIYSFGQYQAIPVWEGLVWFILYYIFLALHTIVLSLLLNRLFKNIYATLVTMVFLYSIPALFSSLSSILTWTPLSYYQMTSILQGEVAEMGSSFAHLQSGLLVLLIYTVIFIFIIIITERRQTHYE